MWLRNLLAAVLAAALAAGGYALLHKKDTSSDGGGSAIQVGSPTTAAGGRALVGDDQYFAGSPALGYADNAAGIVPPAARAIGPFTAAAVANAYQQARTLLIDADLDPAVLRGGQPTAYLALLDPLSDRIREVRADLAAPSPQNDPVSYVTRFDPKRTRLLGHTVKVHGVMSASLASDGTLHVTADYRFVYAVEPADQSVPHTRTVVHRLLVLSFPPPGGHYLATPGKLWIVRPGVEVGNDDCSVHDGYVNPDFAGGGSATGPAVDPYATTTMAPASPSTAQPCGTVTRI